MHTRNFYSVEEVAAAFGAAGIKHTSITQPDDLSDGSVLIGPEVEIQVGEGFLSVNRIHPSDGMMIGKDLNTIEEAIAAYKKVSPK